MAKAFFIFVFFFSFVHCTLLAQHKDSTFSPRDTTLIIKDTSGKIVSRDSIPKAPDSVIKKKGNPHRASLYSAIIPGAGQIYNKKYWKAPIVWAAVGIPMYTYFYNKNWYNKTRYALAVVVNGSVNNKDSLNAVDPQLKPLVLAGSDNSLRNYRDEFRRDQDYSVLFILLFWALNIVDATVDAHLKDFDVSSDLSLRIKPAIVPGSFASAGIGLVFDLHKASPRKKFTLN